MERTRFWSIAAAAALVGALCAACDSEDDPKYDVGIFWQIAGADTCQIVLDGEVMTFDNVRISVYEEEAAETTLQTATVPCTDYSHTIANLERGTYWVRVDALAMRADDTEPLPYYQAESGIRAPSNAEYAEGYKFALEVGTATVEIRWDFADVGYSCSDYGIEDVDISIADELVECSTLNYTVENVAWNTYTVAIDGLDAEGVPVAHGDYADGGLIEIKPKEYVGPDSLIVVMSPL